MIASPMYFSTVPPWRRRTSLRLSKTRARVSRTISGSWLSPIALEPTMSAKRTVTTRRSSGIEEV